MIQLVPHLKIFVACDPVDFRKGIDGLVAVCRQQFDRDPFSGAVFVFRNRSRTSIKLIVYDSQGFWLCLKRLSKGRLVWWPDGSGPLHPMAAQQLHVLLYNGDPQRARMADAWRDLK